MPSIAAQRLLGLLGRLPERDGGVGGVGRDEDAVVGRCGAARRGEAREAEAEPEPEEQPRRGQRSPVRGEPPPATNPTAPISRRSSAPRPRFSPRNSRSGDRHDSLVARPKMTSRTNTS